MHVNELAVGILQITHRGSWHEDAYLELCGHLDDYIAAQNDTVYVLLNFVGATNLDEAALFSLVTARQFHAQKIGLAIMVGRRAQLQQVRTLIESYAQARSNTTLRLMGRMEDAYEALLDRQVMDQINGITRYGG